MKRREVVKAAGAVALLTAAGVPAASNNPRPRCMISRDFGPFFEGEASDVRKGDRFQFLDWPFGDPPLSLCLSDALEVQPGNWIACGKAIEEPDAVKS